MYEGILKCSVGDDNAHRMGNRKGGGKDQVLDSAMTKEEISTTQWANIKRGILHTTESRNGWDHQMDSCFDRVLVPCLY